MIASYQLIAVLFVSSVRRREFNNFSAILIFPCVFTSCSTARRQRAIRVVVTVDVLKLAVAVISE